MRLPIGLEVLLLGDTTGKDGHWRSGEEVHIVKVIAKVSHCVGQLNVMGYFDLG